MSFNNITMHSTLQLVLLQDNRLSVRTIQNFSNVQNKNFNNTNEIDFQNGIKEIILKQIHNNEAYLLDCKYLGNKNVNGDNIDIDDYLNQSTHIDLFKESYGINIPYKSIMKRHKYMWFVNDHINNILHGNYLLAQYFNNVFKNIA